MSMQDLPRPVLQLGEVLIKMESVGICGSDVHGFTGESGRRAPGMVMGHEVVGRIVETAPDVTNPKIGQRVTVFNVLSEHAPTPEEGDPSFLNKRVVGVNLGTRGAMAEYLAIPSANAIPASEEIAAEVSVLAEPVAVALHGFHRLAEKSIKPHKIVIIGSGTIGLCCLLVAKSLGFQDVTVIDLISDKLQRAKNFGGNTLLIEMNSTPDDVAAQIKEKLGVCPDLVIDAVGVKASFDQAFQMVSEKGNLLLIGNLAKSVELPLQDLVSKEISLVGTYGFDLKAFRQGVETLPEFKDQ